MGSLGNDRGHVGEAPPSNSIQTYDKLHGVRTYLNMVLSA